ncbi:hypothetical protein H6F42_17420 [Pseudanabaena sp. FACHB-1998]|uniref:hypothetical protein n=1 Tax=Pseudanabaena sp. FACHB-1998 TaxID=2692858 RepID=UPI001680389B|nr:hypothetical protein [Pseudanabaena sp. FACHB-1998]MBD2178702.1 hypothetical protein [Pseudanabaena sp. FACHB-1998]
MSKIKPFLIALSLLPLSLGAFQIAALAQTTQILSPSKGLAGSASGNNGLSILYKNNYLEKTVILTEAQQLALNDAAQALVGILKSGSDTAKLVTILGLQTSNLNLDAALALFENKKIIYKDLVASENITIKAGDKTLILRRSKYQDPLAAAAAAAAILEAGGTIEQAELAASLAGTGADPQACMRLVAALSGLFANLDIASLPSTKLTALFDNPLLTATGIKTKSIDDKNFLIAQTRAAVQVDANKLNKALLAYNEVIDKSNPKAVANLAKNEDFKLIGQNLRQLRASIR